MHQRRTNEVRGEGASTRKPHGFGAFSGHLGGFRGGTAFAKQFHVQTHLEPHKMKKTLLAVTLAALTSGAATTAVAADPKAPASDFELSGNVAVVSDYRFRGNSETNRKAAFQGGFDLAHKSGFYIGNWNSNIKYTTANDPAYLESDFYGGYATEVSGVGVDVGVLRYQYPGAGLYNTTEAYLGVSYGPASYKYSRTMSDRRFGIGGSGADSQKGAAYHDLGLEFSLSEQITLGAHAGFTKLEGAAASGDYKDYSVSVSYALPDDYAVGVTYHATSVKTPPKSYSLKNAAVISLSKSF